MRVTHPYLEEIRIAHEQRVGLTVACIFLFLILLNYIFNIFDVAFFLFSLLEYIALGIGLVFAQQGIATHGKHNFVGRGLYAMSIAFGGMLMALLLYDYFYYFFAEDRTVLQSAGIIWVISSLFIILALERFLHIFSEKKSPVHRHHTVILFLVFFVISFFTFGIPNTTDIGSAMIDLALVISYSALLTSATNTLKLASGRPMKGLTFFASGIIAFIFGIYMQTYGAPLVAQIASLGGMITLVFGVYLISESFKK